MTNATNTTGTPKFTYYNVQFRYQCQDVDFATWISLFTLCLAPLIANLIAGTPRIVYLHDSRPPWHEMMVHYNPTAIVWRYFAIIDRRVRTRNWNLRDIAAGNALFWTSHGWDGSAETMIRYQHLRMQTPPAILDRLFSVDTLKTLIVALQGFQVFYVLGGGVTTTVSKSISLASLETIFMPLAVLGLLRLLAAPWLTDDPLFVRNDNGQRQSPFQFSHTCGTNEHSDLFLLTTKTSPPTPIIASKIHQPHNPTLDHHFRRPTSFHGLIVRGIVLLFLLALFTIGLLLTFFDPNFNDNATIVRSVTVLLMDCSYFLFILASLAICTTYFVPTSQSSPFPDTILPCISKPWFKLYTAVLAMIMVVMIIFAALETRRSPCSDYTTLGPESDARICSGR